MQLWTPPSHRVFMSNFNDAKATPITSTLFGAFFLALDRLQQLSPGDGTWMGEGVAMADPAAVECVLRHWTLGDSRDTFEIKGFSYILSHESLSCRYPGNMSRMCEAKVSLCIDSKK